MTTCACGCGREVLSTRGAKYASGRCRAKASRARHAGTPAILRSERQLKSGRVQVILHVDPIWAGKAYVRQRGALVWVVLPCS